MTRFHDCWWKRATEHPKARIFIVHSTLCCDCVQEEPLLGYFRKQWFQDPGPLPPGSTIRTCCPRRTQLQLAIEPNAVKCQSTGAIITCNNVTCGCFREKGKSCIEKGKGNALQKFHTYKQKAISSKYLANNYLIALCNFDLAHNTKLQFYHLLLYPSFSPHTRQCKNPKPHWQSWGSNCEKPQIHSSWNTLMMQLHK